MRKLLFCLLFFVVALSFTILPVMAAENVAAKQFDEAWSLYIFCNYSGAGDYDVYNFVLGKAYALAAKKAYNKGKGPNFERAKYFSILAIPHLKEVQKKYVESEQ